MSDVVTMTSELILYKISDCEFLLSDSRANKTLDYFGSNDYYLHCEQVISIAEKPYKNYSKKEKEVLALLDSVRKNSTKVLYEIINTSDAIKKNINKAPFKETLIIIDKNSKEITIAKKDNIGISDFTNKKITHVIKELLSISETYWDNILFILHIVESIKIAEKLSSHFTHNERESISTVDCLHKDIKTLKTESVKFRDAFSNGVTKKITEIINIEDFITKSLLFRKKESISVKDFIKKNITVTKKEALEIIDKFSRAISFQRYFYEYVRVKDGIKKSICKSISEQVKITDDEKNNIVAKFFEEIGMSDTFSRNVAFQKKFIESLNITDQLSKKYSLNKKEYLDICDAFIKTCNAIVANVNISENGNITLEDFEKLLLTPSLYEEFKEFNVGDYEYQKAIVRFIVEAKQTTGEPVLYDIATHVDIDDVDDRGTVTITDTTAATKVYYNKLYYNPPEVQITLKGGTSIKTESITPIILSTDKSDGTGRYFEVELRNSSYARTTGNIAWVSKGY